MALQLSYDDSFGTTHASAYHRVVALQLNISEQVAKVQVGTYKDAQARSDGKDLVSVKAYMFTPTTTPAYADLFGVAVMDPVDTNPIKVVYGHLKTLPEWSGASDV